MIGERLRYARKRAGLAMYELADECGVSRQRFSLYEKNLGMPRPGVMKEICDTLGVTYEWLMGFEPLVKEKPAPKPKRKREARYTLKEAIEILRDIGYLPEEPSCNCCRCRHHERHIA